MRIQILADEVWSPEDHPEIKVKYGALTTRQLREEKSIKLRYIADMQAKHGSNCDVPLIGCIDWFDFVCQHGIKSVEGMEFEDMGKARSVEAERVSGIHGDKISNRSWDEIHPFLEGEIPSLVYLILNLSQAQ